SGRNDLMSSNDGSRTDGRSVTNFDEFWMKLVEQDPLADEDALADPNPRQPVQGRPRAIERDKVCQALDDDPYDRAQSAPPTQVSEATVLDARGSGPPASGGRSWAIHRLLH